MEFSQFFGFLKLFSESIKLIWKNLKVIALITALSLLLSSILLLLFRFLYESAMPYYIVNSSSTISFLLLTLFFTVELAFVFGFIAIAQASGIATVITAAASYTDDGGSSSSKLSLQDVFSTVKTKWRNPLRNQFRMNRFVGMVAVGVVISYLNPFTIAIPGVVVVLYELYASFGWDLSHVIPVVEDGCSEAAEAVARAEKLVEGQRLDGLMVTLLFSIVWMIVFLSWWMNIVGSIDPTVYMLFLVSSVLVIRISKSVVHTVYYFRCKDYHAGEILLNESIP